MASRNGRKPPNPERVPKSHGHKPSPPTTAPANHGRKPPPPKPDSDDCCPMVAAVKAVRRRRFRLARRYGAMSVRLIAARLAAADGMTLDHVFDLLPSLLLLALAAQPLQLITY